MGADAATTTSLSNGFEWTVKHEWVYLRPAANGLEQKHSLAEFFDWYASAASASRRSSWQTPDEAYFGQSAPAAAAAA